MAQMGFVTAVVLAGGKGARMGQELPKQFLDLGGRPVLLHSLEALESCRDVDATVVVLPDTRPSFIDSEIDLPKVCSVAIGGETRQSSLSQGLVCLPEQTDVVLVQDAARPLVTRALISKVLSGIDGAFHGAIAALPMEDAIKEVAESDEILGSKTKQGLWRAQTPQVFLRASLEDALARADANGIETEDCSELLVRAGYRVKAIEGDPSNIKVTRPEDLRICESILASRTL